MLKFSNINPVARAVGTMGAIAAIVGGVTFAALQSNTVTLSNNTLTSATAALQISNDNATYSSLGVDGMTATLVPGTPKSFTFFLKNSGDIPLAISAHIPTDFSSGSQIPADQVSLALECGNGAVTYTLAQWSAGSAVIPGTLNNGSAVTCTETVTLNADYSGNGQSVKPYDIQFTGNELAAPTNG